MRVFFDLFSTVSLTPTVLSPTGHVLAGPGAHATVGPGSPGIEVISDGLKKISLSFLIETIFFSVILAKMIFF